MPKSKKRRKNGSVVSGKMKTKLSVSDLDPLNAGLTPHDDFDDDVWDWVEAQNYAGTLKELIHSGVSEDGLIAYLHHLHEGYICAQNGEPWIYVPPSMTRHQIDYNSIDLFDDIAGAQDSDFAYVLDFLGWLGSNGYEHNITTMRANGASKSDVMAYLNYLREGFKSAENGDAWTHIPPKVS